MGRSGLLVLVLAVAGAGCDGLLIVNGRVVDEGGAPAAIVGRLLLARRRWPLRRSLTVPYGVILIVAVGSVAAALVPAPAVFSR